MCRPPTHPYPLARVGIVAGRRRFEAAKPAQAGEEMPSGMKAEHERRGEVGIEARRDVSRGPRDRKRALDYRWAGLMSFTYCATESPVRKDRVDPFGSPTRASSA